ncbi:TPA: Rha family transcriptional regulator, partial [Acinetobacter baumannii]|nr:Rha family transcriptional regulator [Acinetobacter baumannii]
MTTLEIQNAVFIQNDQIKTDSLKVAEIFGKPHKDVLQKIKTLDCSEEFTERNFSLSDYLDKSGRSLPMYEMTKDGFIFLAMGYTGSKAAQIKEAYIKAFNQMA